MSHSPKYLLTPKEAEGEVIAALFVETAGPYFGLPGVDPWDVGRDARLYAGPHPVVAHPPCERWGRYWSGGPSARVRRKLGDDNGCFASALCSVLRFGGVLEHPRMSRLWASARLPLPDEFPDQFGGFTIEVDQCAWGHVARKATWLYVVGVPRDIALAGVRTGGTPTHWASGSRGTSSRQGSPVPPGIKVCSAQQRRRTPPEFADWLLCLARRARVQERAA